MSLLTARLLTSRGGPAIPPLVGIGGCGVTLDDDNRDEIVGAERDDFLAKQLAMAEHLPSFSELETE